MSILEAILIAASLCADCFAVSLCSSVTLRKVEWRSVATIALSFAVIQTALLLAGWIFGNIFVGMVYRISHIIGFLLLLYVGGGMLKEGIESLRGHDEDGRDLNGFRNIVLGGIATSIDALAVGVAQSMATTTRAWGDIAPLLYSVFAVTAISVVSGILCGKVIGHRFGHWAEIAGGLVLIGIGVSLIL